MISVLLGWLDGVDVTLIATVQHVWAGVDRAFNLPGTDGPPWWEIPLGIAPIFPGADPGEGPGEDPPPEDGEDEPDPCEE